MPVKRLQNNIAESKFTLPITGIYAFLIYIVFGLFQRQLWLQFASLTISTLLMIELNNRNGLIRIYSRMVSCFFLALSVSANFLFPSLKMSIVQICICTFYILLFRSYQDKRSTGLAYYAFLCIGVASIAFVQIVFYVPLFWILMIFNIMSFSHKTFWASIFGLITPYLFYISYYIYKGDLDSFLNHWIQLTQFSPIFDYSNLLHMHIFTFINIVLLALIGTIHFIRNSYKDKIRIRMLFEVFISVSFFSVIFIILQPQHYEAILPILIINTAPLIGHYVALTNTKITNISFILILLLIFVVTAHNLWIPS